MSVAESENVLGPRFQEIIGESGQQEQTALGALLVALHVFVFVSPAMQLLYFKILRSASFSSFISDDGDGDKRHTDRQAGRDNDKDNKVGGQENMHVSDCVQSTLVYHRQAAMV